MTDLRKATDRDTEMLSRVERDGFDGEVVTNASWPMPPGGPWQAVPRLTVREFLRLAKQRWLGGESV